MTTATLALVAALILIFPVTHVLSILILIALLFFNPLPTAITLGLFGFLYALIKRKF